MKSPPDRLIQQPPFAETLALPLRISAPTALLGLLAVFSISCARTPPAPEFDQFNILILSVDTLGAEHTSLLRPGLGTTPNLERLAREGTFFPNAYSPAPWTQPAVASLFSGLMPSSHGVTNPQTLLAPEQETLAELLEIRGYETGAIVSNLIINRERGFAQGFDDFDESLIGRRKSSRKVSDLAIHWLRKKADSKFFLFVHYYDPHYPYIHHPRFDRTSGYQGAVLPEGDIWELRDAGPSFSEQDLSHLVGRYHEEIAFTDDHIGRVLDELRVQGLYDRTIILVVADHGEELMDHGWIGHTRTLYEELLHVPMILRVGNAVQPRRLEMPVSLLDVMPTLRALAGDRGEDRTQGISLVPYLFGGLEPDRQRSLFAEVSFRFSRPPDDTKTTFKTSLLADGYKTIHDLPTDSWEIYDLAADPEEKNNLAGSGHAAEAELRRRLLAWETSRTSVAEGESSRSFEPSPQDIERLRALGYVE